jgi:hypothetical protein|tara:strand:+ start:899 stop:1114 length:216 start_codon:yes stop_codon:yes gene_type:complete
MERNAIENCIVSVRMPTDFRDKVTQLAKEQFLSFSDYTRIALLEKMKRENSSSEKTTPQSNESAWSITKSQ